MEAKFDITLQTLFFRKLRAEKAYKALLRENGPFRSDSLRILELEEQLHASDTKNLAFEEQLRGLENKSGRQKRLLDGRLKKVKEGKVKTDRQCALKIAAGSREEKQKQKVKETKAELSVMKEREAKTKAELAAMKILCNSVPAGSTTIPGGDVDVTMPVACKSLSPTVRSRVQTHIKTIGHLDDGNQALNIYTTSLYEMINPSLRDGGSEYADFAKLMINGLNSRPQWNDCCWRGMQIPKNAALLASINGGDTVDFKSFTSASTALEEAHKFMGEVARPGKIKILFCICGPGRSIKDISAFSSEQEVLYPPGRYKIMTSVRREYFVMVQVKWEQL